MTAKGTEELHCPAGGWTRARASLKSVGPRTDPLRLTAAELSRDRVSWACRAGPWGRAERRGKSGEARQERRGLDTRSRMPFRRDPSAVAAPRGGKETPRGTKSAERTCGLRRPPGGFLERNKSVARER
ncbi:hypothetical protein NDU88_002379 [Pleurodeles waltl]|uniref:Uncharacterized protein n=1 Tax=Pleurodeles waltl TaxID=8319 RepID=A0AAV7NMZ4_PLEWA|nr:hypothetical protein NDU88_002379 [Pleurodeles waltl]